MLKRAIPELKSVRSDYFWDAGFQKKSDGSRQQLSTPVWYSERVEGRGVGDINEEFYRKRYEEDPTPRNRARMLGAFALSAYVNLDTERGRLTRKLTKEIGKMHQDFQDGKIFLRRVKNWDGPRMIKAMEKQGVAIGANVDREADNFYANVVAQIDGRKPF